MNSDQIDLAILSQCLKTPEAVPYFKENLIEDAVGKINKSYGIYQLYKDILRCYEEVGSVNTDIFHYWLQDYPEVYEKIGGSEGFEQFTEKLNNTKELPPATLTKLANRFYHKRLMLDSIEKLKDTVNDDQADFEQLDEVSNKLQERLSHAKPRKKIELRTAYDIAKEADDLWNIVPFIPTQFKGLNEALGYDKDQGGCMRGNIYSVVATSGSGKPLSVDTMVLMSNGRYKRLGDIVVGDKVINSKGYPDLVTATHDQGRLPVIKISTKLGREIFSALDHTFLTRDGWKEAGELTNNDVLLSPTNIQTDISISDRKDEEFSYDPIVNIEDGGVAECRCLTIENDHTFLANDLIVHNSTLVKSMSNYWLDQGLKVLFINFEEAKDHWERILMTQITKENVYKGFEKNSVEASKLTQQFKTKMGEWGERFMIHHDPDSLYYEDLEIWLRDLYDNEIDRRPDIVIIDTIQSLFTKSGGKARWGEFEQIMVRLEKLCKDMNAVFVLTVQQNNNALRENRSEFNQSDVGGGVTIPQKSSVVMILTARHTELDIDSYASDATTPVMEVHMPKNRITGNRTGKNPPLIIYDDNIKLYEDYELSKDEVVLSNFLNDFGDIDPTKGF